METKFEIVLDRLIKSESLKKVVIVRNQSLEEIVKNLQSEIFMLKMTKDKKE